MEAILALEDGRVFRGRALGATGIVAGEVVFNTGMTGYQEILTDPSYRGQIVTLTVSHVGNTGLNEEDQESDRVQVSGFVVRDASRTFSSWRGTGGIEEGLRRAGVVGISGVDTRALTRHLRSRGVLRGVVASNGITADEAVRRARTAPRLEEQDLVSRVTCSRPWTFRGELPPLLGGGRARRDPAGWRVVALDCGVKRNILRLLAHAGAEVTVVPAGTTAADILAMRPEGVFLSNGPGDPAVLDGIVATVRALLGRVPIFGICLGHQLVARALGGRTYKLKFGHRGTNHPVRDLRSGRVAITSQNHGYAVDPDSLPAAAEVTHVSLYDGTVEGLAHREWPLFTVQFHPEAAPGPHDARGLFDRFVDMIAENHPRPRGARFRPAS